MPATLKDVNIDGQHIPVMAKKATIFGALGNIKKLQQADVEEILRRAL